MRKLISGAVLSATIVAANMAPVFANTTTNLKTGNGVTVNSVAPKFNLVEIEGRTLTDAEAAKVEGEVVFVPFVLVGAGKIIGTKMLVGAAGKLVVAGAGAAATNQIKWTMINASLRRSCGLRCR